MRVYIDVFFIVNFIADYIILYTASFFAKTKKGKMLLSALFGAVSGCVYLLYIMNNVIELIYKAFTLLIMSAIAYYPCSYKKYIKANAVIFLVGLFYCGLFVSIGTLLNLELINQNDFIFFVVFLSGIFVLKRIFKEQQEIKHRGKYEILITFGKRKVLLEGICDSGNTLIEPISKRCVLIVNFDAVKPLFNKVTRPVELCEQIEPDRLKIIPYKTISQSGVMYGFIPDEVRINKKTIDNVVVSVAPAKIKNDILLNPEVLVG